MCDELTAPVSATHAGDGSGRLFIVDQAGTIRILDTEAGVCLAQPFLDLTGSISNRVGRLRLRRHGIQNTNSSGAGQAWLAAFWP